MELCHTVHSELSESQLSDLCSVTIDWVFHHYIFSFVFIIVICLVKTHVVFDTNNLYCYSLYWDYAMNVQVDEIVYVHCHQQGK